MANRSFIGLLIGSIAFFCSRRSQSRGRTTAGVVVGPSPVHSNKIIANQSPTSPVIDICTAASLPDLRRPRCSCAAVIMDSESTIAPVRSSPACPPPSSWQLPEQLRWAWDTKVHRAATGRKGSSPTRRQYRRHRRRAIQDTAGPLNADQGDGPQSRCWCFPHHPARRDATFHDRRRLPRRADRRSGVLKRKGGHSAKVDIVNWLRRLARLPMTPGITRASSSDVA